MTRAEKTILIVEDEAPIRRFLRASLSTQNYEIIEAGTGQEGLALVASRSPDLIILDLGLPDIDGLELLVKLREFSQIPVIILSARGQERDKVAGLDAGADDYLTKPFSTSELLARVRAHLRRSRSEEPETQEMSAQIGDVQVDLDRRIISGNGTEIHLTPIEFKLITMLIRHRGKVLTHKQLLQEVWGPSYTGQSHYLRIYILQLRRKLETDPARPRWLISEPGVGYRLIDS